MAAPTTTELRTGKIQVTKVMFYQPQSHYAIVEAIAPEGKNPTKAYTYKGPLEQARIGSRYEVKGTNEFDSGRNSHYFKIKESTPDGNLDTEGMIDYLQREGPNVGDVRARQIVEKFGVDPIQEILKKPERLLEIAGMTKERADQFHTWAKQEQDLAAVKKKLYSLKIGPANVRKIIERYRLNTPHILTQDPFILGEVDGIGFVTCSKIAEAMGSYPNDPRRIRAGILHVVKESLEEGHVCLRFDHVILRAQKLLSVGREAIIQGIKKLQDIKHLCTQRDNPRRWAKNPEIFPEETSEVSKT